MNAIANTFTRLLAGLLAVFGGGTKRRPLPAVYAFFNRRMSEDAVVYPMAFLNAVPGEPFGPYDIGGTNAQTDWAPMRDFDRVFAMLTIGTFNASDKVTTLKLQQATSAAGAGVKDLTTSGAGATNQYDSTNNPLGVVSGDFAILEARGEDLDVNNGFRYVRMFAAATGNTGTDDVSGFLMIHGAENAKKNQQGAPAANTALYINPQNSSIA